MIYIKYNNEEDFRIVGFERKSENIVVVKGDTTENTSGFKTYNGEKKQIGDFGGYTTVYRLTEKAIEYSNDGEIYNKIEDKEEVVVPTPDEIKQELIDGVQAYMDEVAQSRGYDGILSACSYMNTGVERFDIEGEQARAWRSQVWAFCYAYLDEVLAGNKEIPTLEQLIEELPKIEW